LSAALAVRVFFSPYRNHKTHGSEGVKDWKVNGCWSWLYDTLTIIIDCIVAYRAYGSICFEN
jgi:hypothetical protein